MDAKRRFVHRLDPLMKLRAAERDALTVSAAAALREADQRTHEWQAAARSVARAEAALRELRASGRRLAPDQELRLLGYIAAERSRQDAALGRRDQAVQAAAGVRSELEGKQRDVKALERHRSRERSRLDEHERSAAQKASDDAWLARRGRGPK